MPQESNFKSRLSAGDRLIGCWSALCSPVVSELIAGSDYDWMLTDMEHAPNDLSGVLAQLHAVSAFPIEAIIRPPANDAVIIKRILDLGVRTLLIPMIETAQEAEMAVAAAHYPPRGIRGVSAASRASDYGKRPELLLKASESVTVLLQIESLKGVENLKEIMAVDGVDGIFVGPSDLAASLGHLGNAGHADVQKTIARIAKLCREQGMPSGTLAPVRADAERYIDLGFAFVAVANDVSLLRGALQECSTAFGTRSAQETA